MVKSIKELKKSFDKRLSEEEIVRDGEGRAVIEMTVRNDDGFLSPYSAGERPAVSGEVAEYLLESAICLSPREPLCLKIHSDCIDGEEKTVYAQALRDYFTAHYRENAVSLRRNAFVAFFMALIGLLTLTIGIVFGIFEWVPVLGEALDIFAWVFLWEAVDLYFLERALLRMKGMRYLRFADAEIIFFNMNKALENVEGNADFAAQEIWKKNQKESNSD